MVLKLGQAGTVACPEDKHERLEVLVNLPGLVHHAGLTPGPPHVNREGEMVGIGVSLVRLFSCIFGRRLASALTFAPLRRDLSIQDCTQSLKVESFKIWQLNNMSVLLTQSHQAFRQVLGHGGCGHHRHWDVEPKTVVPHLASSKVRCGWDCHCNIFHPAISDTTLLMISCPLIASSLSTA
jgi:hypothetical protein